MPRKSAKRQAYRKTAITNEEIVQVFGARLRALRETTGLSQRELALRAKVNFSYIGRLERGERAAGIDLVARIASALNRPIAELFPTESTDATPLLREQARKHLGEILERADRHALGTLVHWLAVYNAALGRRR